MSENDAALPNWLEALPNSGALDYFGFRWQRQTMRTYLFAKGASNNFISASTLLYFPAVAVAYRNNAGLSLEAELTPEQIKDWKIWFQRAYFLYVIFQEISGAKNQLDGGFTGGVEIVKKFGKFLVDSDAVLSIDEQLKLFVGNPSRPFGYFTQFWSGPMRYYDAIHRIDNCMLGAYASECHTLYTQKQNWNVFLSGVTTGRISKKDFDSLDKILLCNNLTNSDKQLAQSMILDEKDLHPKTNVVYRDSYKQFCKLLSNYAVTLEDVSKFRNNIISFYLFRVLTKASVVSEQESKWRTFSMSFPFESALVNLFRKICDNSSGKFFSEDAISEFVKNECEIWLKKQNLKNQSAIKIFETIVLKSTTSIEETLKKLNSMTDYENDEASWITGAILGWAIYESDSIKVSAPKWYESMTHEYYAFTPHQFFKTFSVGDAGFIETMQNFVFYAMRTQYQFSIDRMKLRQIPKFLVMPNQEQKGFEIQGYEDNVAIQSGVLGLFRSIVCLWHSAGLLGEQDGKLSANQPEWLT